MTATFIGLSIPSISLSTFFASPLRSTLHLPQVGQEMSSAPLSLSPSALSISYAVFTSFIGDAVRDTLIVSPIPSDNNIPSPTELFIIPLNSVPASEIPTWRGYGYFSENTL